MRLLLAIITLAVAGCGFHLRGAQPLPEAMAKSHLEVPAGSPLRYELESLLLAAGGEVVDEAANATAVLKVVSASVKSRTLSLDDQGRAREYALTLIVRYSLQGTDGDSLSEVQSARVERDFRFDPDNVLARGSEQQMVEQEMYRVAARQIVRRLRALMQGKTVAPVVIEPATTEPEVNEPEVSEPAQAQ